MYIMCMYIMCMCVTCACAHVCVCVCMYYGSAEDIRTRFLKLLRLRRMWENETYISDSRGNDLICCHSSNVMSIFVFSKTFPAICFPIELGTELKYIIRIARAVINSVIAGCRATRYTEDTIVLFGDKSCPVKINGYSVSAGGKL